MADGVIPGYLERAVVEGGDTRAEVMLCQVEATEKQTAVLERIAVALEGRPADAMKAALACCQDGDAGAAAHVLHSALDEMKEGA